MCRYLKTVLVIVALAADLAPYNQSPLAVTAAGMPADEITDALTRAESLYFEAKFKDAVQLLQHADDLLKPRTDLVHERQEHRIQMSDSRLGHRQ